jgi:hypothetical protein
MPPLVLDKFQVVVRQCHSLPPDGYQLVLEIRRRPDAAGPCTPNNGPMEDCGQGAHGSRQEAGHAR